MNKWQELTPISAGRLSRTGRFTLSTLLATLMIWHPCHSADAVGDPQACGSLENAYGPFDYTNPDHFQNKLPIVEAHHFSPETEQLRGIVNQRLGEAYGDKYVAGSVDYTLRAFPNHHRALYAMARYHVQDRHRGTPMRFSAYCYFDRALRFKPDDPAVHMIHGYYLAQTGQTESAIGEYRKALELAPNNAEVHYNLGLIYLEQEDFDDAVEHARRAYDLGFPLPWLNDELTRRGLISSSARTEEQ